MRSLLRRGLVTTAVLGIAVSLPRAQQPPPASAQEQRPTFRTGTNVVRVDVSVIDHKGNPATGLTKNDFEVSEDGIPQTVDTFKFIEATGAVSDAELSLPIRSPEHAAAEAARDDIRVFVIFWDEYHIGEMDPARRAREALADFVKNAFAPTDLVALMDQLTPSDAIRFTRDHDDLLDRVHQLKGRQGVYVPARSAVEESQLYQSRGIEQLRAQVTASALEGTIAYLGALREGRKAILFVSQTIGPLGGGGGFGMSDISAWVDKVVRLANANNTAVYVLDPRGLTMNGHPSDFLRAIADETGGKQFASNYPAVALRQIVKDASAFYLLGYASSRNPADGKFHRIKVRVTRPGLDVRARSGYFAPSLTDLETARKTSAAAETPPEVAKALEALVVPQRDQAGSLWVGADAAADGNPKVTVAWMPRDPGHPAAVTVRATSETGDAYFDGPLSDGRVSFQVRPGTVTIRRTVLDADGSAVDRNVSTLQVPDFSNATLALSTPVVLRVRSGLDLRTLEASSDPDPYAGTAFERSDRMLVRWRVRGRSAGEAAVAAQLLSKKGTVLSKLPLTPVAGQAGTFELQLPVSSLAPGEYLIAIEASHGDAHARQLVPFRAVS